MNKYIIVVDTSWCGTEASYPAMAEKEEDLYEVARELAYDNFSSYGFEDEIASEYGYDPDNMDEVDWEDVWSHTDESDYYSYYIEEFQGTDEEWEELVNNGAIIGV